MFNSCIICTMSSYRTWVAAVSSALWLILAITIWVAFAPLQVGGQAAYVIVNGNSMEPDFHLGDMIIVRPSSYYMVGDNVVYQSSDLGRNVFHRIIDTELDHYILKGDNNSWIDTYQPTKEEIIGKLWAHLPRFGKAVQFLRRPIYMALIAGALGGFVVMGMVAKQPKGKNRMKKNSLKELLSKAGKQSFHDWISSLAESKLIKTIKEKLSRKNSGRSEKLTGGRPNNGASATETTLFTLGLLVFGSIVLGIFSFTRPASRIVPDDVLYQHFGFFSYSATAPASVYDSGTIQSGQPIFPKTTCLVDVNFQYTLVGEQTDGLAGSYQMAAILSEPQSGWQRSFSLLPGEPFTGNTFDARANLDLCQVITLVEAMEQETDFHPGAYTLIITPEVTINGSISGREINDTFEPGLAFRYDRTHFYMINANEETDPLSPTETRLLREEREEPNVLPIFGLEPKVPVLRFVSLLLFGLSVGGLVVFGVQIQNMAHNDRPAFVRIKHEALIVDINSGSIKSSSRIFDVNSIDDLAKLAERHNAMILHEARDQMHSYYVQGDGVIYRCNLENNAPGESTL